MNLLDFSIAIANSWCDYLIIGAIKINFIFLKKNLGEIENNKNIKTQNKKTYEKIISAN